ncbi:MAG: phage tail protein [Gemmatimonadales bacterium]|nr:MAG: phage tail protein [Gemmatimonadales bacterium]
MVDNPYAQFNFLVEIDGLSVAGFSEVSGLTTEQDIIEYREGSDTQTVRKIPGLRKYGNITLKRGFTQNRELWEWRKSTIDGVTERKSGAIILLDEARNEALRWQFAEGWISKWEGPALNATANEAAIESMEVAVEDIRLA